MKHTFALLASLVAAVLMTSCDSGYVGYTTSPRATSTLVSNPYTTTGYRYYSALPAGYVGSAYYYNGRYYTGGRYETGRFYDAGRYHPGRYYYQGQYYYGGSHRHYDRTSNVWGASSHPYHHTHLVPHPAGRRPYAVTYSRY